MCNGIGRTIEITEVDGNICEAKYILEIEHNKTFGMFDRISVIKGWRSNGLLGYEAELVINMSLEATLVYLHITNSTRVKEDLKMFN